MTTISPKPDDFEFNHCFCLPDCVGYILAMFSKKATIVPGKPMRISLVYKAQIIA